jgi:hypothetical protein
MFKTLGLLLGIGVLAALIPATAVARVFVGVGFGGGYYPGYYPGYYAPGYYYPPTPVAYGPPPPVYYAAPPAALANQTSPTFVDGYGRTCRNFQSATNTGTACLQPDGTWRTVY